jgi:imidazolonepropionase-like amidohydrolase
LTGFLFVAYLSAQETFPTNGVYDHHERYYAFTNAHIHIDAEQWAENATLVIRNGYIVSVSENGTVPDGAIEINLKGKHIYPAFIDMYSDYGLPEAKRERPQSGSPPQPVSDKKGAYSWNEALKTEFRAAGHFVVDAKAAKPARTQGFGAVASHRKDGISRGTSVVVALGEENEHDMIIKTEGAHHLSFKKGTSSQNYPNSLMGIIALLRQTYIDADWYTQQKEEANLSLEAWNDVQSLPQVFEVGDRLEALRAAKIAEEFGKQYILMGSGDEYQRLDALKQNGSTFILPLNFPAAYDVDDPYDAQQLTLAQLKHWKMAPANPAMLEKEGISFAFSLHGLKKEKDFLPHLRKAVQYGLSPATALKALTTIPAELLDVSEQIGSLEAGKWANFIITDGDIFDEKSKIHHTWVKGKAFVNAPLDNYRWIGSYTLKVDAASYKLVVEGDPQKPVMKIMVNDSTSTKVTYERSGEGLSLLFILEGQKNNIRLSGLIGTTGWSGKGQLGDGQWVQWSASPIVDRKAKEKGKAEKEDKEEMELPDVMYPFTVYGWTVPPKQKDYLIKNATVWTNESEGIQANTDVLISGGVIKAVGQNLKLRGAIEIDATGKHLTAGIIDEHSHIAVSRGVNEGTQASSAEVSIGDVVNSEDINIYRQLSGGVTTSQLLHGSANPIGGQSAIIKLRWGKTPEEMKFKEAAPFIKFALGENVKQSNWGENYRTRFPQTRMGVEQVYVDYFTRAQAYGELKQSGKAYRKDLDLEAGLEILNSERFITCHSYRQSEINMLMKVAERFGFTINTFTHILEGYKIADIMAAHGAGGSSFSDWWAYKYEVMEAIPYNGALMHEQGVTVAFNSDDVEMARRLNQEAAKAVLFGGVSEEDALKFVTLNPAKLLHIDEYVGSIKVGKHADLVVWSGHPLSMYSKAEQTFIDGTLYFDRAQDKAQRKTIAEERNQLIQEMLVAKGKGSKTQKPSRKNQYQHYHCDDNHDEAQ